MTLVSCQTEEKNEDLVPPKFFDRDVYFGVSDLSISGNENRNHPAHQEIVKAALTELAVNTRLGEKYFRFHEIPENQLSIITKVSDGATNFKSFVMIYPAEVFQNFVLQNFGSSNPDPHAVLVTNSLNKRQFYIIFNAACFSGTTICGSVSLQGMYALVFRQMGFFTGFGGVDCNSKPNSMMCIAPSDVQYNFKKSFFLDFDNMLQTIEETKDFYSY
ncbi:hypothetical protein [Bdellovibrio sp. BCCA]|uniref:hypothetical protein n=1 Tax=Bdellovibrio sp. BCCA TaxID=3136281 RepID=UPI0030F1AD43